MNENVGKPSLQQLLIHALVSFREKRNIILLLITKDITTFNKNKI